MLNAHYDIAHTHILTLVHTREHSATLSFAEYAKLSLKVVRLCV